MLITSRRHFLQGSTLSLTSIFFWPALFFAKIEHDLQPCPKAKKQVVILHDQAHFDETGNFETYVRPRGIEATRSYVNKLDNEAFLSRHWFI